jgi:dGTPase
MDDIISISVNNIYQSREVIEKEIGIPNHTNALDKFITYQV